MPMPQPAPAEEQGAPAQGGDPIELMTEAMTLLGKALEMVRGKVPPEDERKLFTITKGLQIFMQQVQGGGSQAQAQDPRGAVPMEAGANPNARPAL